MKHLLVVLMLVLLLAVPTLAQEDVTPVPEPMSPAIADEIIEAVKNESAGFVLTVGGWALVAVVFVAVAAIVAVWNSAPRWATDASKPILQEVLLPTLEDILDRLDAAADATKTALDDEAMATIKRLIDAKVAELGLTKPSEPTAQG